MMGAIFGTRVYLSGGGGFSEQRKSPSAVGRVRGIVTIRYPGPCEVGTCESGVSSYTRQPDQRGKP